VYRKIQSEWNITGFVKLEFMKFSGGKDIPLNTYTGPFQNRRVRRGSADKNQVSKSEDKKQAKFRKE
jgi:hypothetical protein